MDRTGDPTTPFDDGSTLKLSSKSRMVAAVATFQKRNLDRVVGMKSAALSLFFNHLQPLVPKGN
jgi:hypothetical protein